MKLWLALHYLSNLFPDLVSRLIDSLGLFDSTPGADVNQYYVTFFIAVMNAEILMLKSIRKDTMSVSMSESSTYLCCFH